MLPSEMVILMAIEVARSSSKKLLDPASATGEYVTHLYDSLVERGYLKKNSFRGYRLTPEGRESLFEFLLENKTRAREMIKAANSICTVVKTEIALEKHNTGRIPRAVSNGK